MELKRVLDLKKFQRKYLPNRVRFSNKNEVFEQDGHVQVRLTFKKEIKPRLNETVEDKLKRQCR